jgi:hypothetical protein
VKRTFRQVVRLVLTAIAVLSVGQATAWAQSRPLQTEDPETVGTGMVLLEAGMNYEHGEFYPASGLTGNLWRIGTFGLNFGVSPIAEIQIKGGLQDSLGVTSQAPAPLSSLLTFTGTRTHDFPDAVIGAKIRFMAETANRPALAIKFSTRLPNEGNKSGLGLNTTDFNFYFLLAKTIQSVRVAANVGFGILGSPTNGVIQNDVLDYGISVARAVKPGVEIVGEWNGRLNTRANTPPVGTESRSMMRLGSRFTRGPVRLDAALLIGVTDFDPSWGMTFGFTWVFKAFNIGQ